MRRVPRRGARATDRRAVPATRRWCGAAGGGPGRPCTRAARGGVREADLLERLGHVVDAPRGHPLEHRPDRRVRGVGQQRQLDAVLPCGRDDQGEQRTQACRGVRFAIQRLDDRRGVFALQQRQRRIDELGALAEVPVEAALGRTELAREPLDGDRSHASRCDRLQRRTCSRRATTGGPGRIRYTVITYEPRRRVRFRFAEDAGLDGWHELRVDAIDDTACVVTHEMHGRLAGVLRALWPTIARPLPDALMEGCPRQHRACGHRSDRRAHALVAAGPPAPRGPAGRSTRSVAIPPMGHSRGTRSTTATSPTRILSGLPAHVSRDPEVWRTAVFRDRADVDRRGDAGAQHLRRADRHRSGLRVGLRPRRRDRRRGAAGHRRSSPRLPGVDPDRRRLDDRLDRRPCEQPRRPPVPRYRPPRPTRLSSAPCSGAHWSICLGGRPRPDAANGSGSR